MATIRNWFGSVETFEEAAPWGAISSGVLKEFSGLISEVLGFLLALYLFLFPGSEMAKVFKRLETVKFLWHRIVGFLGFLKYQGCFLKYQISWIEGPPPFIKRGAVLVSNSSMDFSGSCKGW